MKILRLLTAIAILIFAFNNCSGFETGFGEFKPESTGDLVTPPAPDAPPVIEDPFVEISATKTFHLVSACNDQMVVAIKDGSVEMGPDAILEKKETPAKASQIFRFNKDDLGGYRITNVNSSKVIGVSGGSTVAGAAISQWENLSVPHQSFKVFSVDGKLSQVRIRTHSGMFVEPEGETAQSLLKQQPKSEHCLQRFNFQEAVQEAVVTPASPLSRNDSRVVMWADPNDTFAQSLHAYGIQIRDATNGQTFNSLLEPGVIGAGSDYTFSRVQSPYGTGMVYRHRTSSKFPLWRDTQRSQYTSTARLMDAKTYWLVHEFTVEEDWAESNFGVSIGDIHHNSWEAGPYGVLPGQQAPLEFAEVRSKLAGYYISVQGHYEPGSEKKHTSNQVFFSGPLKVGDTHRFVLRFRLGRSWADKPFIQVWRQVNNGPLEKIADRSDVPINYADSKPNECYIKPGLYSWDPTATQRTTYTKGMLVLKDEPGVPTLTAPLLLEILRSL